ncbi:hypothetical protein ARMSODRAFT_979420 [Armillaria solidipes]|uniref:GST N-terminal domain-containing protein n=1 Tax=Armillaria solidipes TaxID=1076256 RepID=A0A2H3AZD8_9AGAR|nr:hypothetical protein ARMSODRAFT_979420 [Armillaria solidipes]
MMNLYDLLTKPAPGAIMTWRTRIVEVCLKPQNLPYQIVDVEALVKKIGAAPTSAKPDDDSTGTVVSDSAAIAAYLDKTYLSSVPILIFTGTKALQLAVSSAVVNTFAPFRPFDNKKINDATAAYFLRGKLVREKLWTNAKENLWKINKWFQGNEFTGTMFGEEIEEWKDVASWNDLRASNLHSASRVATLLYFRCGRVLQTSAPIEGAVLRYNFAPVLYSSCDIPVSTTYRPLVTYACQYLVARWVFPSKAKLTLTSGVKRAFLFGFGAVFYSTKCSENLYSLY